MASTKNVFSRLNGPEYKGKTEIVYEQIRKAILDGLIKPGDKLETDAIAAALSVLASCGCSGQEQPISPMIPHLIPVPFTPSKKSFCHRSEISSALSCSISALWVPTS